MGATGLGRDLAGAVATTLKTGLTADCTGLAIDDRGFLLQTRPAFGGNVMATILTEQTRPQMATVRPHVMPMPERDPSHIAPFTSATTSSNPFPALANLAATMHIMPSAMVNVWESITSMGHAPPASSLPCKAELQVPLNLLEIYLARQARRRYQSHCDTFGSGSRPGASRDNTVRTEGWKLRLNDGNSA